MTLRNKKPPAKMVVFVVAGWKRLPFSVARVFRAGAYEMSIERRRRRRREGVEFWSLSNKKEEKSQIEMKAAIKSERWRTITARSLACDASRGPIERLFKKKTHSSTIPMWCCCSLFSTRFIYFGRRRTHSFRLIQNGATILSIISMRSVNTSLSIAGR